MNVRSNYGIHVPQTSRRLLVARRILATLRSLIRPPPKGPPAAVRYRAFVVTAYQWRGQDFKVGGTPVT